MPKLAVILVGNRIKQVRIWNFPIYNALKERGPAVSKLAYFLLSGRENLECYGKYSRIQLLDPAIRQRTAGFFGSTEKYKFRHIPVCFYNALFWCASVFLQARFFVPCFRKCECDSPGCRSPPSDFDFACQLKNRNWRNLL